MASKRSGLVGNLFFWLFLFGASAGAFGVGFWYTYGATVNVNTKSPLDDAAPLQASLKGHSTPSPRPSPSAAVVPGPLPVTLPSQAATPQPAAMTPHEPAPTEAPATPQAAATPQRTPEPANTVHQPEIYRVQVGAFDSREAAQKQVDELQTVGINAVVVWDGGAYHAQLGAFSDRTRAISVADEVNIRGYSVTIRH